MTRVFSALSIAIFNGFACLAAAPAAASYTVSTVAGSSVVGDGAAALNAQLSDAEGLAVDRQGNVYISDAGNHRVRKVTPAGLIQTVAGTGFSGFSGDGGPAPLAQLNSPYGLAVDAVGNLYIADLGNNRVRKISTDGVIQTVAGAGQAVSSGDSGPAIAAQLNGPRNVAADSFGNLYVSEFYGHRVRLVTSDGNIQTIAGNGTAGAFGEGIPAVASQLAYPAGIAVDFTGALYIADSANTRIRRVFNGVATTVPLASFSLNLPTGVSTDGAGGIYIADSGAKRVLRRTSLGAVFVSAGAGSSTLAALDSARDVSSDPFGNLYIADARRVRVISGAGAAAVFAGTGIWGFGGDGGPAAVAILNNPSAVAVDPGGNLYIADTGNHRIRKVTAAGVIGTAAGTGAAADSGDGFAPTSTSIDGPEGLLLDPAGTLWIGEYFGNRVRKLSASGFFLTVAGNGTAGYNGDSRSAVSAEMTGPGQPAIDSAGNLYIPDSGNHRIRKVAPSGIMTTVAGTGAAGLSGDGGQAVSAQLNGPRGVAIDAAGNLFIADTGNNCIRKITPGGQITTVAGGGAVSLAAPRGVLAGFDQNLYIADTGNHRILALTPDGNLTTIAGTGTPGFFGDGGDALAAQFDNPVAITMDPYGAFYIADFDNNRIRRLTPGSPGGVAAPVTQPGSVSTGLMNAASLLPGPVAPGEIVAISGNGFGPMNGIAGVFDGNGILGNLISETQVLFDGVAAPLVLVQQSQVTVQAPYELQPGRTTHVQLYHAGSLTVDLMAPVAATAPGLFTQSGSSGVAMALNADGSTNSNLNPAVAGSVISLFATGEGQTNPAGIDGKMSASPYPQPVNSLVVRIGGLPGAILFAAEQPGQAGVVQLNVRIPANIAAGAAPVVFSAGSASSQDGVTVWIR